PLSYTTLFRSFDPCRPKVERTLICRHTDGCLRDVSHRRQARQPGGRVEFRMLGPLEGSHEHAAVPLGDHQQRFILVVLLLHANKPVSAERLTEIVWGDQPGRRSLVRGYINKLRNAFRNADDVSIDTTP